MDREHPMAPEFAFMLQEVPIERRKGFIFRLNGRGHGGGRLKPNAVSETVSDIGKAAGVKVYTHPRTGKVKFASAHDLWRTFGERWAARLMPVQLMELMRHKNIETTLRYYVGANAQRTAQTIWTAFQQQGQASPPAAAPEVVLDASRNKTRNSDLSDHQKTSRPGRIRTCDQGIMSPLLSPLSYGPVEIGREVWLYAAVAAAATAREPLGISHSRQAGHTPPG